MFGPQRAVPWPCPRHPRVRAKPVAVAAPSCPPLHVCSHSGRCFMASLADAKGHLAAE